MSVRGVDPSVEDLYGVPDISKLANIILTRIFVTWSTIPTIEEIYQKINDLTKNILEWVDCNGLALNLKKTNIYDIY